MKNNIKASLFALFITLLNFFTNFLIFTFSYNKLSTPFLLEEQRAENADYIMTSTLGMYLGSALLMGVLVYVILKRDS